MVKTDKESEKIIPTPIIKEERKKSVLSVSKKTPTKFRYDFTKKSGRSSFKNREWLLLIK